MRISHHLPPNSFVGLVLVLGLTGCGKGTAKLIPVAGKVIVGTNPLTKGTVILYPDAEKGYTSTEEARGTIDAEGNYKMFTRAKEGVTAGWYKVAVTAFDPDPKDPTGYKQIRLLPERYLDFRNSNLAYEVSENSSAGAYDLPLEAK